MRIAICQMNPRVGDPDGNAERALGWIARAAEEGAQVALFPEQTIGGYPAEDLLHKPHFLARCAAALEELAAAAPIPALVGWPEAVPGELDDHFEGTPETWNSAAVIAGGSVVGTYRKLHLPNYAVFDEKRYFRAGSRPLLLNLAGVRLGLTICEDVWVPQHPVAPLAAAGAQAVLNLSASPYRIRRGEDRQRLLCALASSTGIPIALCNQACGQDELVFDGHSLVVDGTGAVVARSAQFAEQLLICDLPLVQGAPPDAPAIHEVDHLTIPAAVPRTPVAPARPRVDLDVVHDGNPEPLDETAEVWGALRLGLRDYVTKNGFADVVLGLSGGIDSAVVMALAVDALGSGHVHAVTMPSRYTSGGTRSDAHAMAETVGVPLLELPIEGLMQSYLDTLSGPFVGLEEDVTEENLQARVRGNLLMALSNKFGWLVLTTGNKSEVSVGYMTLYGDMAGGFAPIKDVPKTLVYRLAAWRNGQARKAGEEPPITETIITRPPSAELRADQQDTDSLPPYEQLDPLLQLIVERDHGVEDAVAAGYDRALAERIQRMVDRAEYKRRQAPPGIRITAKAFGRDRRMPITNAFDGRVTRP